MFWLRVCLGGREYRGVLDSGANISIVAEKMQPHGDLKNIMPTAAIRMGHCHLVHSCEDCEVHVPLASMSIAHRFYVMKTEAFDFVLGTNFFAEYPQFLSLMLQAPNVFHPDHPDGQELVPLEQSEHTLSYLRVCREQPSLMMVASQTEDYQRLRGVLDQGLKEFRYSEEDVKVDLLTSDKEHVLDPYCSKRQNCC